MGGRLLDYIAQGYAANRPLPADMPARIAVGGASIYYATDTSVMSFFNADSIAWNEFVTNMNTEQVQDIVGAMILNGGGLTIVYDDLAGTVTITSTVTQYTDEMSQDAVAAMIAAGTHVGLTITYDDVLNKLSFVNTVTQYTNAMADARVAAASINALADVDTVTVPPANGDGFVWDSVAGLWKPGASGGYSDEQARDAVAAMLAAGIHTGISVTNDDPANSMALALVYPTLANTGFNTWVNQGTATAVDSIRGIAITGPNDGAHVLRGRHKAAPATPYIARVRCQWGYASGSASGIVFGFRDSATGKMQTLVIQRTAGIFKADWTSPTVAAFTASLVASPEGDFCLFAVDDGVTISLGLSYNMIQYASLFSVSKAAGFLGAAGYNQLVVGMDNFNGTGGFVVAESIP